MSDLLPVIAAGFVSGSTYALLALGLVIIFRATDTVNFAIGDIATLGVFVGLSAMAAGASVAAGFAVAILFSGLFGVATERVLIRPLGAGHASLFVALVVTIGLGLLIHAVIATIWGHRPLAVPPLVSGSISIFGISLSWSKIATSAIALVAMAAVAWFFRYTMLGIQMRASAEDHFAARIIGLRPGLIAALAWFLGCALAGLAAFFLAIETSASAALTLSALFRAFAGVFLGGLTSLPGAAVGGFVIGILDNVVGRYMSANYRDTIVFAVIVAVLFIKPAGFMGSGRSARV
ncbi:branched-chain amino acid ABC transporter permease [Bosea sp. (in: a-proteobacteria)]|jgi:branched-chain amino acid transport system permease protein|uniref:branched-chain amino acid ABC transporter permease n=1 Tax=Bosea sp. (in: a-proteobacteria) TaxID=1871050 RepID=UPI002DDCCD52|nr:branched-chain amino acid ABC transporter permease [Bosea sp. (in: a-proteobacteria)]HEV2512120.1 branched-chain amino acid ABC transporter permease [Bosea sp. (in: a-proteobacteria)]